MTTIRTAGSADIEPLATIWYDGWQDAHAAILPPVLARDRTRESFRDRLAAALPEVRTAGPPGDPLGFCLLRDDELWQLYVAARARGTGVAAALVADAETRLAARGVGLAWLACAIGNDRAARFYEKCGWQRAGVVETRLDTAEGVVMLDVWRYEKQLPR